MNNSLSIFANALASENLSFSFDQNAETASFDTKNRHLTMPIWDVSETVQTMLIAHEISHALWTPYERSEELLAAAEQEGFNKMLLQRIANMVEDVRIEKMMKAKYPGTRRDFYLGYKEIVDRDMFSFSKMDIAKSGIINRLNLHFKWGVPGFLAVNLSPEEQKIADMVDGVKTFEETIEVAKFLYRHPEMQEAMKQVETSANMDGQQQGDPVDGILMDTDIKGGGKEKDGDTYTSSVITLTGLKDYRKAIISTDMLRDSFTSANPFYLETSLTKYREYVRESDAFVRQLVAQFERKKAADEIRRERPKQTGMLNLDRLHQYRTHDDIFLSKIVKKDGKNHGIVFMLDFSGSMQSSIGNCFLQVLQLVWFCEKAKIPFDVFGFTDVHGYAMYGDEFYKTYHAFHNDPANEGKQFVHPLQPEVARSCPTGILYENARLIHLASSKDDAKKREQLLSMLYGSLVSADLPGSNLLTLHGTPTVEALAIATEYMKDWVTENNIQIPTLMVVTDGAPNGVSVNDAETANLYRYCSNSTITVVNEMLGTVERVHTMDTPGLCIGNMVISTMLNSLRAKLNARCIGMYVGGSRMNDQTFMGFCMSHKEREDFYGDHRNHNMEVSDLPRYAAAEEAYKDGCVMVHPDIFPGYDSYFLTKTPKIVKDEDAIADGGTFTKIKNTFIKTMAKRSGNRVFLTRYVDIVAGQPVKKMIDSMYGVAISFPKK
jgi:hypothetical protein